MSDELHSADRQMNKGISLLEAGRLDEAAAIFDEILAGQPRQTDALHLRGMVAWRAGQIEQALELLQQAVALDDSQPAYHDTLGLVLQSRRELSEAEACFRRAISLAPDEAGWWNNLGNVQHDAGDAVGAARSFAEAIRRNPEHTAAYYNLGNTLWGLKDLKGAADCFRQACVLSGEAGLPFRSLVSVLVEQGEVAQAEELLQTAVEDDPENAELRCLLGGCLMTAGQPQAALPHLIQATELDADSSTAWYGCGCARMESGQFAAAATCFEQVLRLDPGQRESRHNLGRCLFELGQADQAISTFRSALAPENDLPLRTLASILPAAPSADNQAVLDVRRTWAHRLGPTRIIAAAGPERSIDPERTLRAGYMVGDLDLVDELFPLPGLLQEHDPAAVEVHLFCETAPASAAECPAWLSDLTGEQIHALEGCSNRSAAEAVRAAGIDVLVDLCGFARSQRLPMYLERPAPVQVAWLGLNSPAGLPAFDGLIADDWVLPPNEQRFYSGRISRLPGSCLTFAPAADAPPVQPPPCLDAGRIVFGSMAPQYHLTPGVLDLWASILRACPEAGLMLKNSAMASRGNREFLYEEFALRGIDSERLRLAGPADRQRTLKAWSQIDIALDTFPMCDAASLASALWQGVPVMCCAGDRWVGRLGVSLLRAAGLDEFLAASSDDLADRAIALAWDPETPAMLARLRHGLRDLLRASPLCDTAGMARNVEGEYRVLWRQWCHEQAAR